MCPTLLDNLIHVQHTVMLYRCPFKSVMQPDRCARHYCHNLEFLKIWWIYVWCYWTNVVITTTSIDSEVFHRWSKLYQNMYLWIAARHYLGPRHIMQHNWSLWTMAMGKHWANHIFHWGSNHNLQECLRKFTSQRQSLKSGTQYTVSSVLDLAVPDCNHYLLHIEWCRFLPISFYAMAMSCYRSLSSWSSLCRAYCDGQCASSEFNG